MEKPTPLVLINPNVLEKKKEEAKDHHHPYHNMSRQTAGELWIKIGGQVKLLGKIQRSGCPLN